MPSILPRKWIFKQPRWDSAGDDSPSSHNSKCHVSARRRAPRARGERAAASFSSLAVEQDNWLSAPNDEVLGDKLEPAAPALSRLGGTANELDVTYFVAALARLQNVAARAKRLAFSRLGRWDKQRRFSNRCLGQSQGGFYFFLLLFFYHPSFLSAASSALILLAYEENLIVIITIHQTSHIYGKIYDYLIFCPFAVFISYPGCSLAQVIIPKTLQLPRKHQI